MFRVKKKLVAWLLLIFMVLSAVFGTIVVRANYNELGTPIETLKGVIISGSYTSLSHGKPIECKTNQYKGSNGGNYTWGSLFSSAVTTGGGDLINEAKYKELKPRERQRFLEDIFKIAHAVAEDGDAGLQVGANAPTGDTIQELYDILQNQSGMTSAMLGEIMSNVNTDFGTASKWFAPFSGVIGSILGFIVILIMSLLGLTMALDIAYIVLPPFQMAVGGAGEDGKKSGISGIISSEARAAVKAAEGGGGGQSGDGTYKAAIGQYFKFRWKGLVMLVLCLLYLASSEIYSLIAFVLDLFTGFM